MAAVTVNWERVRQQIIDAAVTAVNAEAENTAEIARDKAPVRKVFKGGRQTVRFKTAQEIERDRDLRAQLGLGPEILATPERIAALRAAGRNPKRGIRGPGNRGLPTGRGTLEEYRLATTVEHPGRRRRDPLGVKPGAGPISMALYRNRRDHPRNLANRPNKLIEPRRLSTGERALHDVGAQAQLTSRGRYELRTERAASQALRPVAADINARTGEVVRIHYGRTGIARLGGGLRDSIRVERASAGQFPVIKASVVAGGGEITYAKFQELGTRHNPAHPFLRPALAVAKGRLPDAVRRSLRRLGR